MQEFNCFFYRLINKQITLNHNFGISKVCNMDKEAEIFKSRLPRTIFWHARLDEAGHEWRRGRSRQPYWKGASWFVFFVLVSIHYFTIVLFLWSSSTYNTHISGIKAAKVATLKPFPSSTNFGPDLRLTRINCFTICFYKSLYNLLKNICNTNHEIIFR